MFKIAISGKANAGKNTVSKILYNEISKNSTNLSCKYIAFADPIKKTIKLMFPKIPNKYLYGSSKFRAEIIPGAFKYDKPLTIRQLLIDLGTAGREYNKNIWVETFDVSFQKAQKQNIDMIIVTDVRFENEFEYLRKNGFYQIRLKRNECLNINDASETSQDVIKDTDFDCIIHNDGTLDDLKLHISRIVSQIKSQ